MLAGVLSSVLRSIRNIGQLREGEPSQQEASYPLTVRRGSRVKRRDKVKESTKEQKLEELVKWVAKELCEMDRHIWGLTSIPFMHKKYTDRAKQILTNPEYPLGIIVGMEDREVAPKTFTISYPKWSKPAMVIPLSEYLQEV